MKGMVETSWVLIGVIIVGLIGGSYYFTNGFTNLPLTSFSVVNGCQSNTDSSGKLLVPLMGYYECAPAIGGMITDSITIDTAQNNYYDLCTMNTPSCIITKPSAPLIPTLYCDQSEVDTDWLGQKKCKDGTAIYFPASLTINSNAKYSKVFIPSNFPLATVQFTLQRTYTPFTLWQTAPSSGRTQVYQTNVIQCSPPSSSKLCTGDTTGAYCTKGIYHGSLTFYETSNYFDKLVIGPVSGNTYTYNGQTVYGAGVGTLYSIGQVKLSDGVCYNVPGQVVGYVDCLPGAISGGQQCGNDFKWYAISSGTGSSPVISSCPAGVFQCPGQGNYIMDFSDPLRKTSIKYTCDSGQCVRSAPVVSECSNSNACPTGKVCSLNPTTGMGSCLLVGSNPLSGRDTGITCPDGSFVTDVKECKIGGIPWAIIFGVIAGALVFLIVGRDGIKNRDGVDLAIAGIVGAVAGLVVYFFITNIVAILIGTAIGLILGGALIYVLGFGGIVIALIIGLITKAIKGD